MSKRAGSQLSLSTSTLIWFLAPYFVGQFQDGEQLQSLCMGKVAWSFIWGCDPQTSQEMPSYSCHLKLISAGSFQQMDEQQWRNQMQTLWATAGSTTATTSSCSDKCEEDSQWKYTALHKDFIWYVLGKLWLSLYTLLHCRAEESTSSPKNPILAITVNLDSIRDNSSQKHDNQPWRVVAVGQDVPTS